MKKLLLLLALISTTAFSQCVIDGTTVTGKTKQKVMATCDAIVKSLSDGMVKSSGDSLKTAIAGVDYIGGSTLSDSLENYLPLSGDTMSGDINMGGNDISNVLQLYDSDINSSIDVENRKLGDTNGTLSLDYNGVNYLKFYKSVSIEVPGKTFSFASGTDQMTGSGTLVSGVDTISNTTLSSTVHKIFIQLRTPSGTLGIMSYSITSGNYFIVKSTLADGTTVQALDNSTFVYFIIEEN